MSMWNRTPRTHRKALRLRSPFRAVDRWRGSMYLSEVATVYGAFLALEHDWYTGVGVILVGFALRLYSGGYR